MQRAMKVFATVALLGLPSAVGAQTLGEVCAAVTTLGDGQWVEYSLSGQTMGMNTVRYANMGSEDRNGQTHHRYELKVMGAQSVTSELLIAGNGGPWDMDNLVEMTVSMAGQPPMTLSGQMLQMAQQNNQTPDIAEECAGSEIIGRESVTVPAGSIQTVHIRSTEGTEVWASLDVPMAVVKVVTPNGPTMELKSHGTGAGS